MENAQQQRITRWLIIMALLIIVLIAVSLLIPGPDDGNPGAAVAGVPSSTPTPSRTPFPTQPIETVIAEALTNTPFPTVTNPPASTPSAIVERNCVYPSPYWRNHPEAWLADNILIGQLTYTKDEAIEVMETDSEEVPDNVLKQLFATILNILKGSDPTSIENTVLTGIEWLSDLGARTRLTPDENLTGIALIDTLEKYNNGQTGPELCADSPRTSTPPPEPTSTPTPTSTNTPVFTFAPPTTITPTKEPREPQPPTAEPTEPAPPPTEPPPPPTQPPPPPTEPPTEPPPRPTPTLAP